MAGFERVVESLGLFMGSVAIFLIGTIVFFGTTPIIVPSADPEFVNTERELRKVSSLPNIFNNHEGRYSIAYPAGWGSDRSKQGSLILNGKEGTLSYLSSVNIQTVRTKLTGGEFSSVDQMMEEVKNQVFIRSPNAKFLESGPITINESNGAKAEGRYVVFVYGVNGMAYKQWQVVVLRNDGQVFYAWAYTSPLQQYAMDLSAAEEMLKSWNIY